MTNIWGNKTEWASTMMYDMADHVARGQEVFVTLFFGVPETHF